MGTTRKIIVKRKPEAAVVKKKTIVVKKQKPEVVRKLKTGGKGIVPRGMGPQAVTILKDGRRVCWRFYLVKFHGTSAPKTFRERLKNAKLNTEERWFVIDAAEDSQTHAVARGSSVTGYEDIAEATKVCKSYREKYGEYVEFDF